MTQRDAQPPEQLPLSADKIFLLSEASRKAALTPDGFHSQVVRLCSEVLRLRLALSETATLVTTSHVTMPGGQSQFPGASQTKDLMQHSEAPSARCVSVPSEMHDALDIAESCVHDQIADPRGREFVYEYLKKARAMLAAAPVAADAKEIIK